LVFAASAPDVEPTGWGCWVASISEGSAAGFPLSDAIAMAPARSVQLTISVQFFI
jgi:hypothetical protein